MTDRACGDSTAMVHWAARQRRQGAVGGALAAWVAAVTARQRAVSGAQRILERQRLAKTAEVFDEWAASGRRRAVDAAVAPDLVLPAEAFVRLVYGRLDPDHTPAVRGTADLAELRAVFPGP